MTAQLASKLVNVPVDVLTSYLAGKRKICFSEVSAICKGLGVNPVRLLYSTSYPEPKLAFRNVDFEAQLFAARIEDVFLLIKDFLPEVDIPRLKRSQRGSYNRFEIVMEAAGQADKLQSQFKTPESFVEHFSIPIFPVRTTEFKVDAFTLAIGNYAAICLNTNNPPSRIRFSLAHEIAHLLFDRDAEMPVDVFIPDLYWKERIDETEVPEFFAYKFAQFYLIKYEKAFSLAQQWPNLDLGECQVLINELKTSRDVIANAIFDVLLEYKDTFSRFEQEEEEDAYLPTGQQFKRMDWEEDRGDHGKEVGHQNLIFRRITRDFNELKASPGASDIYGLLSKSKGEIASLIRSNTDAWSDDILTYILGVLQIELR